MFKSVTIKNLRAITELQVDDLTRVNLFVGQNGSGKTTLLEGIFFLIGATNPKLPVNANIFRGLPYLSNALWPTYFHNMNPRIPIEIEGTISETSETQNLVIRPREQRYTPPQSEVYPSTSASLAAPNSETTVGLEGLEMEYVSSENPNIKTMSRVFLKGNEFVEEGAKERPVRGFFVNPVIHDWKDKFGEVQRKKQVHEVVSLLREIEPHILDLRLHPTGFLLADIGLPEMIPANLMGGGIAKFMTVAFAMLDSKNGIVLIDEVENGLHYSAQEKLWEAIFNWADKLDVQVFATTHSRESITAFCNCAGSTLLERREKLFRIEREGEKFRAVEYTKELLAESLESKWEVR